jgi:hypothetical protein
VAGKTITTEEKRALVDRRRRDRIDTARRAQLDCRFDVTARSFASGARFDTGFDKAADVVEMIDDGFGKRVRKLFVDANDVVARLKIESTCRVGQQLCIADDHRHADSSDFIFRNCFENDFRTNPRRVAHRDADARQNSPGSRSRVS